MLQDKDSNSEEELLQSLYLMLLYISGREEHNPYLADPYPRKPNSKNWHSKETFVNLHCWIGLDFYILDRLEEGGFLKQPQRGTKKQRTYIQLNKQGIKCAREILREINLRGAKEALTARNNHEEYLHHKNRIDLISEEQELECDNDCEED